MISSRKRISLSLLIALLIFFIIAGLLKKDDISTVTPADTAEKVKAVEKNIPKEIPVKTQKKISFKSNDEIKKEYGKLETVILWNGKNYTGAVISTDPVYSIVTVDGTVNIPIKDVKIREIIR
jgi:biopolymer transport protein ExbD